MYHCRYTFRAKGANITELEYYEWVDAGMIDDPFTIEILQKLKKVIEKA